MPGQLAEEPVNRKIPPFPHTAHPQLSYTHLPPRLKLRSLCDIRRNQSPHNTSSPGERAAQRSASKTRCGAQQQQKKKVPAYMRCPHARWGSHPSPIHARTHACVHAMHARQRASKASKASNQKSPTTAAAFPKGSSACLLACSLAQRGSRM